MKYQLFTDEDLKKANITQSDIEYAYLHRKRVKDIQTKCYFCKKPIRLKEFGGIVKIKGKAELFHNNIVCLQKFYDWDKKHNMNLVNERT